VKTGEVVDAVILAINPAERRISLGLKQALGDPWADVTQKFPAGSAIEGPVTSLPKFGAFVQLADGVEGLVHISEITADKRLNHPQEALKVGERVKALVVSIDREKRMIRLSMKQLVPTDLDEYLAEHQPGDIVTGRVISVSNDDGSSRIEFGDGVFGSCLPSEANQVQGAYRQGDGSSGNVSDFGAQLMARWKGGAPAGPAKPEALHAGQIRQFRITRLDPETKLIEVALA